MEMSRRVLRRGTSHFLLEKESLGLHGSPWDSRKLDTARHLKSQHEESGCALFRGSQGGSVGEEGVKKNGYSEKERRVQETNQFIMETSQKSNWGAGQKKRWEAWEARCPGKGRSEREINYGEKC